MNDHNIQEDREHEERNSVLSRKPWYCYKRVWVIGVMLVFWYMFYRPIEVTREPWQVLDPGKPDEPLKFEVLEEGTGPVVEPGDLIQISLWRWSNEENRLERRNDWWIWVGFRTKEETPFHAIYNIKLISVFVGLKEGDGIKLLENTPNNTSSYIEVYLNPFGNNDRYYSSKHINRYIVGRGGISPPSKSGYSVVHIKKVFKGQLEYRTTKLYDGTWFYYSYNVLSGEFENRPRNSWYDEARYEGVSADGKRAIFQYGPVPSAEQPWEHPSGHARFRVWPRQEWENLPIGVQVE